MDSIFQLNVGSTFEYDDALWTVKQVTFYKWEGDDLAVSYLVHDGLDDYHLDVENTKDPEVFLYTEISEPDLVPTFRSEASPPLYMQYDGLNFEYEGTFNGFFREQNDQQETWNAITAIDYFNEEESLSLSAEIHNGDVELYFGHLVDRTEITQKV